MPRGIATTDHDTLASRRVMEKVGMTRVRTFRITPADLAATGTFHGSPQNLWEGDDVGYALQKAYWELQNTGN